MRFQRYAHLTGMFTIFHLCEFSMASLGCVMGITVGYRWLGWFGAVVGGILGAVAGWIIGRIPFVLCFAVLKRSLRRCDVATLRRYELALTASTSRT